MSHPDRGIDHITQRYDVCVVGGGMAGLNAAIASARNGARTVLVQDRPVLGGNASSEVRMWICGAHGKHNKETGILEEIQLDNQRLNPALSYAIWDAVLYGKAAYQPNLTLMLNTAVCDGRREGDRLVSVKAWQLTSQTWFTIEATQFIDCSGDSILAPISGALTRWGREAASEFDEDIQPAVADARTMGNSILIQMRRTDTPQPFTPPPWAVRIESPEDLAHRVHGVKAHNFWWIEIGGLANTLYDAERIRHELYRLAWGVWDYLKNVAPQRDEMECWALEFLGSLPGKRENRRYVGDHVLTQNEVRCGEGTFDDAVAYGGWSMDDHHPAGIFYPGKPTIFHAAPSPYDIPYRSLYSRNVANLLCAGRNISVTHAALSSTRVMATCAMLGQAAGTAAALCIRHRCDPRSLSGGDRLRQLQQTLMDDDAWIPGRARGIDGLAAAAQVHADGDASRLLDGHDRDRPEQPHAWQGRPGDAIVFEWPGEVEVPGMRLVLDSNLNHDKRMPCSYPQTGDRCLVPDTLVRELTVEARDAAGAWRTVAHVQDNHQRLLLVPLAVRTRALRITPRATWGSDVVRVFSCEPSSSFRDKVPAVPSGPTFRSLRDQIAPSDLAPPQNDPTVEPQRRAAAISA